MGSNKLNIVKQLLINICAGVSVQVVVIVARKSLLLNKLSAAIPVDKTQTVLTYISERLLLITPKKAP